ncbi:MAG: hypothetical protein J2P31_00740, partial [Blastocatellia bacterium]|nr:hypothetical protein [Blastocatellia bacterium]
QNKSIWAEIKVVDSATGRGIPLVELETVNALRFVTDNAGRVAFHEPGLMGREIFFNVRSHGYEAEKDGFGISGARLTPRAGQISVIKLKRRNIAERLCRLTGEGLYRDSVLLGYQPPLPDPLNPGRVGGQDSIQAAVYHNRVYWFWGDTLRMNYPLGLFRVSGATTPLPELIASDPAGGIAYQYFVDASGFARAMMPLKERPEGVVWVDGILVVADSDGTEKLLGHYSRRKGLEGEYEQGIAVYNPKDEIFEPAKQLPLNETWRHPSGHSILYENGGVKWILFGNPALNVRVPATLKDVFDPAKYEAFTCVRTVGNALEPALDPEGKPRWRWQKELPPMDSKTEQQWVKDGKIKPEDARFCPADAANPADRVILHNGTVRWNAYRKRWVLIAGQLFGKSSMLGEVWYSESADPTGPFRKAVKVVTHDRQTFYNVCHHSFLDREGGRVIHFEGTYANTFSGNPDRTSRYDYNQILYRLDLDAEALRSVHEN